MERASLLHLRENGQWIVLLLELFSNFWPSSKPESLIVFSAAADAVILCRCCLKKSVWQNPEASYFMQQHENLSNLSAPLLITGFYIVLQDFMTFTGKHGWTLPPQARTPERRTTSCQRRQIWSSQMNQTELAAANSARSGWINMDYIIKPGRQLREKAENENKNNFGASKTTNDKTVAADLTTPPVSGRLSGDESGQTWGGCRAHRAGWGRFQVESELNSAAGGKSSE